MVSLVIQSITATLLMCTLAHGQAAGSTPTSSALTPNVTLVLPAVAGGFNLSGGEVIQASVVTVQGQTTIFQIVDSIPDPTQPSVQDAVTVTIALSPTQYQTNLTDPENGLISNTETCTFAEDGTGNATCVAVDVIAQGGTTKSSIETDTLMFASVPVVALNFGQTSTTTKPTSSPTSSPQSAALGQYKVSKIALCLAGVVITFSQTRF